MNSRRTLDWNPRDTSILRDQRSAYDDMRERCPVAHSDFLDWSLFRHQDIVNVLSDPKTYSSASRHLAIPNGMDSPAHIQYRHILEPYFQPEQMSIIEPHCRRIAVNLIQALLAQGEVEFISAFAQPFSLTTYCVFLGWPAEDWEYLSGWTRRYQEMALSQDRKLGATLEREFAGYVMKALHMRREAPASNDIITRLMQSTIESVPLNDEEIISILRNWTAGHGTVAAALGILMFYLAEHKDVQQSLRSDPTLLPVAIDEILRADGPLVMNRRTTTRAVEIGGQKIGVGEKLTLNWIAANRDGRTFDDPETVRFDREPGNNLLFGAGVHRCQGILLAHLEMRIAMEELLAHTTTIRLSNAELPTRDVYPSNGFQALPVRLS